ncbi:MAG: SDR family NAD(P)-dependent oxidoreductase, partial [Bacteroidia bacterium]
MRHQKLGCIINISSIAGKLALPLFSVYHATKFAVEGFSESLQYELRPFNIKVKLIEPGIIYTDFYELSMVLAKKDDVKEYEVFFNKVKKKMDTSSGLSGSKPIVVAKEIYKAAVSDNYRLRYPVGGGAVPFLFLRKILPGRLFSKIVYRLMYQ